MSHRIDYSRFNNVGDSDDDSDSIKNKDIHRGIQKDKQMSIAKHPASNEISTVTRTIQDPNTGRCVFLCNETKIYSWDQNLDEVNLYIPAPPSQQASSFEIRIEPQRLQVGIRGHDRFFIDEETFSKVNTKESSWYLDKDSKEIHIVLIKAHRGQVWDRVLKGINTDEKDGDEQHIIDPFLQQKLRKDLLLERFQEEHRGFDFRDAEFNGSVPDPREFLGGVKYS
jgi:CS domain.